MGQVRKQAASYTIVNFLATAVAALATVTIYAQERELYGLLGFLMDTAVLFSPFILLSTPISIQRYFPYFSENETGQRSVFSLGLMIIAAGVLLMIPIIFLFKGVIIPQLPEYAQGEQAENFFFYIFPVAIAYAIINYLFAYSSIFKDIALPSFFAIANKFFAPFVILIYSLGWLDVKASVYLLILFYFFTVLFFLLFFYEKNRLQWANPIKAFDKIKPREFFSFGFFSLLTVFGKQMTLRIDSFMVPLLFTVGMNGEYRIAAFMAGVLLVPFRSIAALMSPMIANAWKKEDLRDIEKMYHDSSIHSLLVGTFIFLLIYYNIDALLEVMPRGEELVHLRQVFIVIAAARLVDLGSGVNDQIIAFSKYYKFNFYLLFILGISNVVLNLLFADWYGFIGIAIATALSLSFFNAAKMLFIFVRYRLQPFSWSTVRLLVLIAVVVLSMEFFPELANPWLRGAITGLWITLLFVSLAFVFKISRSWNALLLERLKRLF